MVIGNIQNLKDYYIFNTKLINFNFQIEELIIFLTLSLLIFILFLLSFFKFIYIKFIVKFEEEIIIKSNKNLISWQKALYIKEKNVNNDWRNIRKQNKIRNKEYKNNKFFKEKSSDINDKSNLLECEICNHQFEN